MYVDLDPDDVYDVCERVSVVSTTKSNFDGR